MTRDGEAGGGGEGGKGAGWRGWVGEWYEEGEKRVEKVGKRYGILGYIKVEKGDEGDGTLLQVRTQREKGSGAAEKVADAISAYVLVKACTRSFLLTLQRPLHS